MSNPGFESDEIRKSLQTIPQTALQAIYHAVTGKTENLSKRLEKNVLINYSDFQNLYLRLIQQAEHYDLVAAPTVTIVIKQADNKSYQYSSWERFCAFQISSSDITSEISLKIEFITQLPNTDTPQRFVISVGLDSGLPVIHESMKSVESDSFFGFFAFFARKFPTVEISIDFVDFLIAKIFMGNVEEWFHSLDVIKVHKLATFAVNRMNLITSIVNQGGKIGLAVFLASYVWFNKGIITSVGNLTYAFAIAVGLLCILSVLSTHINNLTARRLFRSIIPSIILVTEGDRKAYSKVLAGVTNSYRTLANILLSGITVIGLNILSSYIYSIMSKP